jgi:hypothetical protein
MSRGAVLRITRFRFPAFFLGRRLPDFDNYMMGYAAQTLTLVALACSRLVARKSHPMPENGDLHDSWILDADTLISRGVLRRVTMIVDI